MLGLRRYLSLLRISNSSGPRLPLISRRFGYTPNAPQSVDCYSCARMLKDCMLSGDPSIANIIHCVHVKNIGFLDLFAQNVLLDVYAKLGSLRDALHLFDEMPEKNVVSFATLMGGCIESARFDEAMTLFRRLCGDGHTPNQFVFTMVLKLYVHLELPIAVVGCLHAYVSKLGYKSDMYVGTALIDAYSIAGSVRDAEGVFDGILVKDAVSWTGMISCYAENGYWGKVLQLFSDMRKYGLMLNNFTICSMLRAAIDFNDLALGKSLHASAIRTSHSSDDYVAGALLDLYAKCGDFQDVTRIFCLLPYRTEVLCSYMISCCERCNEHKEALEIFLEMRWSSLCPNPHSFCSILQACAKIDGIELGEQVHGHSTKIGMDLEMYVANALLDFYAKCNKMVASIKLFMDLCYADEVSWNTIISGFVRSGYGEEALHVFHEMLYTQVERTEVTYSSALRACASLSSLMQTSQIHCIVSKCPFHRNILVGNALIDAYSKCGGLVFASKVFDAMSEHNNISWNVMISAYSLHGLGLDALDLMHSMCIRGFNPDKITFVSILSACGNAGLVDHGKFYFTSMTKDHGIEPSMEHYSCLVRLLGRSGHLAEAMEFIEKIPMEPDASVWRAMLSVCLIHKNTELGKVCASKLLVLEPLNDSNHILSANLHARAGMLENMAFIRKNMKCRGLRKEPGLSWIEVQDVIHSFSAGDTSHPDMRVIRAMLEWMRLSMRRRGIVCIKDEVLHNVGETEVEYLLWMHSERLALAFGLAMLVRSRNILIMKNLRFCSDCHSVFKLISDIAEREIIVRDMNRFHHFRKGICTCGDYW